MTTRSTSPARVRLSTPGDLVATVPHLLGFTPRHSLVVVSLHGSRHRVGMSLRVDLPPPCHRVQVAELTAERIAQQSPGGACVVVVDDAVVADDPDVPAGGAADPGTADDVTPAVGRCDGLSLPHRQLVDAVTAALDRRGVPVTDAVLSRSGRWWSYLCRDTACCPVEGTAIDAQAASVQALAAARALRGRGVLPDRDAIVRSVAPPPPGRARGMAQAVARSAAGLAGQSRTQRSALACRRLDEVLARAADPRQRLDDEPLADLVAVWRDVTIRDAALARGADADDATLLLGVLLDLAGRLGTGDDAAVCAMLAWLAYAEGECVLATAALERALASDPAYSLARLLEQAVERQLPPSALRDTMVATARACGPGISSGGVRQMR